MNITPNCLVHGDAISVLTLITDECVDLIYADPPFFTRKNYKHYLTDYGFSDTWSGDTIHTYIEWLSRILAECHRVLSNTGTLYLHLDWHAAHYAKVALDQLFGYDNFLNEIVWHYGLGVRPSGNYFPRRHDTILSYRKGLSSTFNVQRGEVTEAMRKKYCHQDEDGRFYMYSYGRRYYLQGGKQIDSVWDIPAISPTSLERIGYPTQKPELLLARIINSATKQGDVVFDPFCGSGTTPAIAERLERRWIASDISDDAIQISRERLNDPRIERLAR